MNNNLKNLTFKGDKDNDKPKVSGRSSVAGNIAMFQTTIDVMSGRGSKRDDDGLKLRKVNPAAADDIESQGRNSVKDMILQFSGAP